MESFAVPSALYNSLFTVHEVDQRLLVDYLLWNQLKASLPPEYRIPDLEIMHAFEA
jgi:hypothetical protein